MILADAAFYIKRGFELLPLHKSTMSSMHSIAISSTSLKVKLPPSNRLRISRNLTGSTLRPVPDSTTVGIEE
jgi:hypothetical protein